MAALLLVVGCCRPAQSPGLPPGVELLPPEQMKAYCDLDPDALCKDFVDVPRDALAEFELRLGDRMRQRHLERLTPNSRSVRASRARIDGYVRRYFAYREGDRIVVEGFFACPQTAAPIEPTSYYDGTDALVLSVDDAGDCAISVRFYSDKPQSLEAEAPRGSD